MDVNRIQTEAIDGFRLTIEFTRQSDRHAHTVALESDGGSVPLLTSIEGTPDERWPASPALQHLHVETRQRTGAAGIAAEDRVALLVGMAGRSHWSLSVERAADGVALVFDVACRVDEAEAAGLQSTYRLEVDGWERTPDGWALSRDGCRVLIATADNRSEAAGRLAIGPRAGTGKTIRWEYAVRVSP